jgi:uncharacterized protein (TIGR02117 family)
LGPLTQGLEDMPKRRRLSLSNLLAFFLLYGCSAAQNIDCGSSAPRPDCTIYIDSSGWHTGIVMPVRQIADVLPEAADFPDAQYLEFGWGARAYYANPKHTLLTGLRVLLFPSESVLLVTPIDEISELYAANIAALPMGAFGCQRLARPISNSFERTHREKAELVQSEAFPGSRFYRARRSFAVTDTCNTWVARGLAEAGCGFSPPLPITASPLMRRVRKLEQGVGGS